MEHSTKMLAETEQTGKPGRPRIVFDLELVERLASRGNTLDDIAWICNCSPRTVDNRFQNDEEFHNAICRGRAQGRNSLRKRQWESAMDGNPALLIWLGKQMLGQRERWDNHITGTVTHEHGQESKQIINDRLDRLAAAREETSEGGVAH